ncbi:MAG: hypothetical protein R3E44_01220 [Paracoccaceae bacterium]
MPWKRILASLLLTLSILSMGVSALLAEQSGTMIVICGANGPETVVMDDAGRPADPFSECRCKLCSDCVFAPFAAMPDSFRHVKVMTAAEIDFRPGGAQAVLLVWPVPFPARGPPSKTDSNVPL